jgi:hypothetical protein
VQLQEPIEGRNRMNATETTRENPEQNILRELHKATGAYGRMLVAYHGLYYLWEEGEYSNLSWSQQQEFDAIMRIMVDLKEELGAGLRLAIEYFKDR